MIVLISLTFITITCWYFFNRFKYRYDWDVPFGIGGVLSSLLLFIAIISLPIYRMATHEKIIRFESVRTSFEESRSRPDNVERYTRIDQIVNYNAWLAGAQYYNKTVFDIWIPDDIENIKSIK
jgi:hypothetical protein